MFLLFWWLVARSPLCRCMRRHRSRATLTIVPGENDDIAALARQDRFDSDTDAAIRAPASPMMAPVNGSPIRDTLDINDISSPPSTRSVRSSHSTPASAGPASLTGKPEDREPNAMESLLYRRLEFTTPPQPPKMTRIVTRWSRCLPCRPCGCSGSASHERIIAMSAILLSVAYIICGLLYVISLSLTPVSINTVVYNSQCVVVFFLSVWLLGETVHWIKGVSVILCVAGVVIVALSANNSNNGTDNIYLLLFMLMWCLCNS
jgi:multidrug transporter EmrE-like cation transporter